MWVGGWMDGLFWFISLDFIFFFNILFCAFILGLGENLLQGQWQHLTLTISLEKNFASTYQTLRSSVRVQVPENYLVLLYWTTYTMLALWGKSSTAFWVSNTKSGECIILFDSILTISILTCPKLFMVQWYEYCKNPCNLCTCVIYTGDVSE